MDPNANLKEMRMLVQTHLNAPLDGFDVERLVELVEALDEWISKGGALPRAWIMQWVGRSGSAS